MEPSADEDGGGERGRAEQKGRVNRDINSQRLMLLGRRHGALAIGNERRRTFADGGVPPGRH